MLLIAHLPSPVHVMTTLSQNRVVGHVSHWGMTRKDWRATFHGDAVKVEEEHDGLYIARRPFHVNFRGRGIKMESECD